MARRRLSATPGGCCLKRGWRRTERPRRWPGRQLHQVRTDHANVLVGRGRFRLRYSAFEAIPNEGKRGPFVNPLWRNRMGKNKDRYAQRMSATPPIGEVECPPSRHQSPGRCTRFPKILGGLRRDLEHHLRARQPIFCVSTHVPSQKALATLTHRCFRTIVRPSNE